MPPYVFIKTANHSNLSGLFLQWVVRQEGKRKKLGYVCMGEAEGLVWEFREEPVTHSGYGAEGDQGILLATGCLEVCVLG